MTALHVVFPMTMILTGNETGTTVIGLLHMPGLTPIPLLETHCWRSEFIILRESLRNKLYLDVFIPPRWTRIDNGRSET